MTIWASSDLLAKCKLYARRPAVDQAVSDTNWYLLLTDSQSEVYSALFSRHPDLAYSAPVLMTTADSGYTYTFGTDADGDAIRPSGHTDIFPTLSSVPDYPLVIGSDYMFEGSLIRMPNNTPRLFGAGPYARFVTRPDTVISASVQPTLFPKHLRMLLVWKALEAWASRPGSGADPSYYMEKYDRALNLAFLDLATMYNAQGSSANGQNRWWTSSDIARTGLNT